jgi:lysophospholipase L1-like esterase
VFADRTLRQIVHASAGGDAVRVHLSNAFGGDAVSIGAAHVALRASGARIVPGTDRALTFGGASRASIPPGAVVVSDPVDLRVPALADLAVSLHLPAATSGSTMHASGTETSYVLAGDRAALDDPPPVSTTTAVYFLTGVDVRAPPDARVVVCLGDSLTDGVGSTPDSHHAWPSLLAARLVRRGGSPFAVVNHGYAGNRLLHDGCAERALARFDRDVLGTPGVTDAIVFAGINDIGTPTLGRPHEAVTAEEITAAHRRLIARARGAGLRIHGATLTPFKGSDVHTPEGEEKRRAVNDFIRQGGEFDAVLDFDAAVRDDAAAPGLLPQYDAGDHVHLNDAGYEALANAVDLGSLLR